MTVMLRLLTVICLAVATMAQPGFAAGPVTIGWDDLLPEKRPYHDPFLDMKFEQISALARLHRLESRPAAEIDADARAEAAALREGLVAQGLDPDWLFRQREIVMTQRRLDATEPNEAIIGKSVRLPGYLLPLEMTGEKTVEFLLVPTVGACIHTPPPPANQMVYVRFDEGFVIEGLYKPVWIRGEMQAQNRVQSLSYVDGVADIETSYKMEALSVEPYAQ